MNHQQLAVIPEPKKTRIGKGKFLLNGKTPVISAERDASLVNYFKMECSERLNLLVSPAGVAGTKGIFLEVRTSEHLPADGYRLIVGKDQVRISGKDQRGLFNGIQTLLSLAKKKGAGYEIPCLEITDGPDLEIRGVHLTLGANVYKFQRLVNMIKELARCKVNMVIMEYEDMYPWQSHPKFSRKDALTPDQIRELEATARRYQVDLVPLLDSLGHANPYLKHKEYAHLSELPGQIDELCPLHPGSLNLIKDLCKDLLALHPSKYFHIGGDEVFRLGDFCPKCKAFIREKSKSALFVDYYSKLCNWLKEQGKIPIIWGDMLINEPEAIDSFPKDVIIMDWDYCGEDSDTRPVAQYRTITSQSLKILPAHIRVLFEPYWRNKHYPQQFKEYPYVKFFQDRGFRVIGASASSATSFFPDFSGRFNNNRRFSQRLVGEKAMGLMNTFWPSYLPVESAWYGLLAGAEYSWNARGVSRKHFDGKFTSYFYGVSDRGCKIMEGLDALEKIVYADTKMGAVDRRKIEAKKLLAQKAIARIRQSKGKVKKNTTNLAYMEIAAELEEILLDLQLVAFDAESICLGTDRCMRHFCVDLAPHVNGSLGNPDFNNLINFPHGKLRFRGVPFNVPAPVGKEGRDCIFLRGTMLSEKYPREVKGIKVDTQADKLYFLHGGGWVYPKGEAIGEYRMNYDDGTVAAKKIVNVENIVDSYVESNALSKIQMETRDGFLAWEGHVAWHERCLSSVVCFTQWENPCPCKTIKSIDMISSGKAVPILIAVTGGRGGRKGGGSTAKADRLVSAAKHLVCQLRLLKKKAAANYGKFTMRSDVPKFLRKNFSEFGIKSLLSKLQEQRR